GHGPAGSPGGRGAVNRPVFGYGIVTILMRPVPVPPLVFLVLSALLGLPLPTGARAADAGGAVALQAATTGELDQLREEKASLDQADQKLDSRLRGLRGLHAGDRLRLDQRRKPGWKRGERIRVSVALDALDDDARAALTAAGLQIERESPQRPVVEGWTVAGNLGVLAALDGIRSVRPADRGFTRVTSSGDIASRANLARGLGVTGLGVRVGVISDGIDGAAASFSRGELPVDAGQLIPAGCSTGSGSEGT